MTTRSFGKRVGKHYRVIRLNQNDNKLAFADHVLNYNRRFNPKTNVDVLHIISDNMKKLFKFMRIYIKYC